MERLPRQTKPVNCPRTDGEAVGIPGNPGRQPTNDQQTTGLTTSQRPGEQLENQLKQAVIGKYSRQSSRPTTGQRSAKDRPMTGGQPAKQGDKTDEGPVVRRAPRFRSAPSGLLGFLRFLPGPVFGFSRARFSGSPGPGFRVLPGSFGTFRLPAPSGSRHLPAPGSFRPPGIWHSASSGPLRSSPALSGPGTLGPGAFRPSSAPSGASRACRPFPLRPAAYSHFLKRKKRIVSAEQSTMSASAKR